MEKAGEIVEKGEKNGTPFFSVGFGDGKKNKFWVSRDYKGFVPSVGDRGTVTYTEEQKGEFKMKIMSGWEPGSGNGAGPSSASEPQKFVGREPGVNDHWTAYRWALSSAIDVLGGGKKVSEYQELAEEFFLVSWQRAEFLANPSPETPQETQSDWD